MASNGFPATKNGQSSTCKLEEDFDVKVDSICAVNLDAFLKFDVTLKFFLESADPEAGICGVIMWRSFTMFRIRLLSFNLALISDSSDFLWYLCLYFIW